MALAFTTFRARTRGKSPKEFTYQGVGKPVARPVKDSETNPLIKDANGNPVSYTYKKQDDGKYTVSGHEGLSVDEKGNLVLSQGLSFVEVDDANFSEVLPAKLAADATPEAKQAYDRANLALLKEITESLYGGDLRDVVEAALSNYNERQRDKAAEPLKAVQQKEDELAEIVGLLRANNVITSDEQETKWRRTVSMGFDAMFEKSEQVPGAKLNYAYTTALGKKVADKRPKAA